MLARTKVYQIRTRVNSGLTRSDQRLHVSFRTLMALGRDRTYAGKYLITKPHDETNVSSFGSSLAVYETLSKPRASFILFTFPDGAAFPRPMYVTTQ
jgi:hypothetical protein